MIRRIEALDGVAAVIIGMSYGGKSLGKASGTGSVRIQRVISGGLKGVMQTEKGLQEIFIRTGEGKEDTVAETVREWR